MVSEDVQKALAFHRGDYARITGTSFQNFFCPMLFKDEKTELCMGHVLNAEFPNSCRLRVVQRADIDHFYGSVAEADFVTLVKARGKGLTGMVFESSMSRRMPPRLLVDGEEVGHYRYRGHKGRDHSRITLENEEGDVLHLVLQKSPHEVLADQHKNWNLVVERDFRLCAIVTLIKAGFLTMFRIHGYRWALSAAGISVGRDILGKFYEENRGKPVAAAREAALAFFRPYMHMVRPIEAYEGTPTLRGTLEDNRAGICFGSSGRPFALVVCVRVDEDLHAVLMPAFQHPDSVEAYWNFLTNDNESLRISNALFDAQKGQWNVDPEAIEACWPKRGETFDFE